MSFYLAVPEHAVRNRPIFPIVLVLLCGLALGPYAYAQNDDVVEATESGEVVEVDNIVDPLMPGPETEDFEPVSETALIDASEILDEGDLEIDEAPELPELTPHSAEYRVKISVLSGRLNTSLVRTETGYEANHRIRPTGLARMVSSGSIEEFSSFQNTANGIVPIHYVSNDSLTRDKTQADVYFNYETSGIMGGLSGTVNGEPVENILDDFAHDRVSIQYQLMSDLMGDRLAETYVLFDIDEIKILNVSVIGTREIRVPAGEFTAVGVQHQAEGSSRVTTLWCVEELDFLPVLIEQHRHGERRMSAQLRDYSPIEG